MASPDMAVSRGIVTTRAGGTERTTDVVQCRCERCWRDIRCETSDDAESISCACRLGRRQGKRPPYFRRVEFDEAFRQHADDRVGPAPENECTSDDARIGGQLSAPERVAEDGDWPPEIAGLERAATRRYDAEERQKSRCHLEGAHSFSRPEPGHCQVCSLDRFELRQRSSTLAPGLESGIGHPSRTCRGFGDRDLTDSNEGAGIPEGQRGEEVLHARRRRSRRRRRV